MARGDRGEAQEKTNFIMLPDPRDRNMAHCSGSYGKDARMVRKQKSGPLPCLGHCLHWGFYMAGQRTG